MTRRTQEELVKEMEGSIDQDTTDMMADEPSEDSEELEEDPDESEESEPEESESEEDE
jgi:hypothetical protein